jgi:hypothetical protein
MHRGDAHAPWTITCMKKAPTASHTVWECRSQQNKPIARLWFLPAQSESFHPRRAIAAHSFAITDCQARPSLDLAPLRRADQPGRPPCASARSLF